MTRSKTCSHKYRTPFVREVLRRVRELPGISRVAMSTEVPLSLGNPPVPVTVEGLADLADDVTLSDVIGVRPDYFAALGTPLVSGRFFAESDQPGSQMSRWWRAPLPRVIGRASPCWASVSSSVPCNRRRVGPP